jgi:hypothetical protein
MSTIAVFLVVGGATALAASQLEKNSVGSKQLKKNSVTTAKIKKEAVNSAKIQNGAVTNSKLGDNAVTAGKVADGSLTSADLAPGVIPTPPTPLARTARLKSGETITGLVGIEQTVASASGDEGASGSFQILPKEPIPAANRHMITGASGPGCPGVGQADPGQLCVYQTYTVNANSPSLYAENGQPGSPSTYGFLLEVNNPAIGVMVYNAVWAYTGN